MMHRLVRTTAFGLALSVGLIACGSTATPSAPAPTAAPRVTAPTTSSAAGNAAAPNGLPEVDPATVTGAISIAGSSTVFPLTAAVVEEFQASGSSAQISVDSIGTSAGFQRFCGGTELDIVDASRAITAEEQARCVQ